MTEEEVSEMQTWMSMNKGVTFDGFSDNWFRNSNQKILTNWWNNETFSHLFPLSFESLLIPLNKAHPNIPNKQQAIQTDNHSEQLSEMVGIKIQKTSPKISQLKNRQRSDRIHLRLSNLNEHSITHRGDEAAQR